MRRTSKTSFGHTCTQSVSASQRVASTTGNQVPADALQRTPGRSGWAAARRCLARDRVASLTPVVLRRKRWVASGAKTTRMARDHATAATTGCCIGHAEIELDGFGLPKKCRAAAVTALTGFQFAMTWSQPGIPDVGTIAFETMASGNKMMSPMPCADSGPFETMPRQAQAQESA